jgi:hypothetical protein
LPECHMHLSSHLNNLSELSIIQFSPSPVTSSLLSTKWRPHHHVIKHSQPMSFCPSLDKGYKCSYPCQTTGKACYICDRIKMSTMWIQKPWKTRVFLGRY